MRKFDNYTVPQQLQSLVLAFAFAVTMPEEKRKGKNIYDLAADQGKISGLRAEDFSLIKHMTIEEMAKHIG